MKALDFAQQLAIEAINLRVSDLIQTIHRHAGISGETAAATKAIDQAVAPVISKIMARDE